SSSDRSYLLPSLGLLSLCFLPELQALRCGLRLFRARRGFALQVRNDGREDVERNLLELSREDAELDQDLLEIHLGDSRITCEGHQRHLLVFVREQPGRRRSLLL